MSLHRYRRSTESVITVLCILISADARRMVVELNICITEPCMSLFVYRGFSAYPLRPHKGVLYVIEARGWSVYFRNFILRSRLFIRLVYLRKHVAIFVCLVLNRFVFGAWRLQ